MAEHETPHPPREAIYHDPKLKARNKSAVSEAVYGFAEAFTGHGLHYVFQKDQLLICRFFWIIVCIVATVFAVIWYVPHSAYAPYPVTILSIGPRMPGMIGKTILC